LANIVNALREAAQATKSSNLTTTALLAAITVKTETFGEGSTQAALNIVSIGPAAVALFTNPTLRMTRITIQQGCAAKEEPVGKRRQSFPTT
jgi:hypothetical protein